MNQDVMMLLHDVRNKLTSLKGLVHMHMTGDRRYEAENLLSDAAEKLNEMYVKCLQCDDDDRRET